MALDHPNIIKIFEARETQHLQLELGVFGDGRLGFASVEEKREG